MTEQEHLLIDHFPDNVFERFGSYPSKDLFGFLRVTAKSNFLCRAEELRIDPDIFFVVQIQIGEGGLDKFPHAVRFPRCNNIIVRTSRLEHQPHGIDVIRCISPVAVSIQVAENRKTITDREFGGSDDGQVAGGPIQDRRAVQHRHPGGES